MQGDSMDGLEPPILVETWGIDSVLENMSSKLEKIREYYFNDVFDGS